MYPTTIDGNTIVVSYADSSWANAEGFASQHGSLVLFTDARVTEQVRLGTLVEIWQIDEDLSIDVGSGSRLLQMLQWTGRYI